MLQLLMRRNLVVGSLYVPEVVSLYLTVYDVSAELNLQGLTLVHLFSCHKGNKFILSREEQ